MAPSRPGSVVHDGDAYGVTLIPCKAAIQGHVQFELRTCGSFDVTDDFVRVAITVHFRVVIHR